MGSTIVRSPTRRRLLLAAAALLCAPTAPRAAGLEPWTGGPAPALALKDLDGRDVRLASFAGRTVLVNFWATWCAPCVEEMPSLQYLRETLDEAGVEVLAVNVQENAARVKPFVERFGLTFPILRDTDGAVTRAFGVRVFPTTFVIGPDGRIALSAVGEIAWSSAPVLERVRAVATSSRTPRIRSTSAGSSVATAG